MSQKAKTIPEGYHTITPFLTLKDAKKAIQFYKTAFNAKEVEVHECEDGRIMHAVIKIGDSLLMICDEFPEQNCGISPPLSLKGTTMLLHIYVDDVDAAFNQAVKAGAKVKMPVADMFWGDRYGQLQDPYGHLWSIATHKADLTPEEVEEGAKACMSKPNKTSCC
jgi:uncharacterized glyoxalase superfamily protein PhnB